jgi:hypothetical protein
MKAAGVWSEATPRWNPRRLSHSFSFIQFVANSPMRRLFALLFLTAIAPAQDLPIPAQMRLTP